MDDVIRYDAGRVIKPIAEQANLELCDDTCTVARVRVTVSLHTRDVTSSTCERDTQSVQSQRSLCGKNEAVVGTTTLRIIYQVAPCLHIQYNFAASFTSHVFSTKLYRVTYAVLRFIIH